MKKTLLASAALALIAAVPAYAADAQAVALDAPIWSGFYVGVEGGYAQSNFNLDGSDEFDGDHHDQSVLGGVYLGHDWQMGAFVFGAVADFDFVDLHDSFSETDVVGKGESYNYDVDWVASARARAGYAYNNFLIYGSGGIAFADIDAETVDIDPISGDSRGSSSDIETGGTLGAGIEYAFSPKLSGKLEYQHYFFDDITPGSGGTGASFDPSFDTVKIGLAYRF